MSSPYSPPGQNPYSSPAGGYPPRGNQHGGYGPSNDGLIKAPAIALIVVGVLDVLYALYALGMNIFMMAMGVKQDMPPNLQNDPAMQGVVEFLESYGYLLNIAVSIATLLIFALMIYGAVAMLNHKNYGLAITAAVLAIIPCGGIMDCCLVEGSVGIWALVILLRTDVKNRFR